MAGSLDKKAKATTQYQANLEDPAMKARQVEIQKQRARKLGDKAKAARTAKHAASKRSKLNHIQYVLSLPEITGDFPSLLDLTIVDRENKAAREAAEEAEERRRRRRRRR